VPPSLRLGKYIVEGLLGPGGVTETYLTRLAPDARGERAQGASEQRFALKLLRPDRVAPGAYAKAAGRFAAAGRQLVEFRRPGFGKVVDVSEDSAMTFVVTEYVAGCDLVKLVTQGWGGTVEGSGVDPVLAGIIGSEIARLLHVGHAAKPVLCHLGLAPQNVVMTEGGEIVLLDAGIACSLRAITEQPAERWRFVAPELQGVDTVATELSDRQGVAADLYSLGALLYFLVAGKAPAIAPRRAGQPRQLRMTLPDIPGVSSNLGAALRTLLAPEPEDRPESAAMLVEWLAAGVDAPRERRRLIAEALRLAEKGPARASESPIAVDTRAERGAASANAAGILEAKAEIERAARRSRAGTGSILRWTIAGLLLAAGVGVGAAQLTGRWPGQKQTSPIQHSGEGPARSAGTPRVAPEAAGEEEPPDHAEDPRAPEAALGDSVLSRVAGHLIAETVPPGAMVWVDGVLKGKTFADLAVGEGGHRIVLIAAGHRMFRDVIDTTRGAIIRRTLAPIEPPTRGNGSIDVECRTSGKFPILLDDEETGLFCPVKMMPTSPGKHTVGIFVPTERRAVLVETTVENGSKPAVVTFRE